MRIGILSDTHGDLKAFEQALVAMGTCDFYLHAGDVLYHGPRNNLPVGYGPKELAERIKSMNNIYFVHGNCDADVDEMVTEQDLSHDWRLVELDGYKFFMIHGYKESVTSRIAKAKEQGADLLIYGHTHVKELYKDGNLICLNPGSPAIPKDGSASVAVFEDGRVRLIDLATHQTIAALTVER